MNQYTLPFDISILEEMEGTVSIDMSNPNFNVPGVKQKRSAYVFLRNLGVPVELDFTKCSYEDKEEYLLLFMQENIDVDCELLTNTWIEILSARDGGGVVLPSILSVDEIDQFLERNKEFLDEMYQLINSLPIYSMYCSIQNTQAFNVDDFEKTDYDGIKITNFSKLSKYSAFMLLIDGNTPSKFYTKLFIKDEPNIIAMMERLPYLNLLTAFFSPPEIQTQIADGINDLLKPHENNNCEGGCLDV